MLWQGQQLKKIINDHLSITGLYINGFSCKIKEMYFLIFGFRKQNKCKFTQNHSYENVSIKILNIPYIYIMVVVFWRLDDKCYARKPGTIMNLKFSLIYKFIFKKITVMSIIVLKLLKYFNINIRIFNFHTLIIDKEKKLTFFCSICRNCNQGKEKHF